MRSIRPRSNSVWELVIALVLGLVAAGCGGGGGGGGGAPANPAPSEPDIIYSKNRNGAGQIAPVLAEGGASFDANAADSPAVVVDSGRPNGDKYMLYYEAESSGAVSSIAVVTSTEEDFDPIVLPRDQVIAPGSFGFTVGATDPAVIVDKSVAPNTLGRYRMWFEGRSGVNGAVSAIVTCISADGIAWSDFDVCTGLAADFASVRIADPAVITDGNLFGMYFEAIDTSNLDGSDGPATIGYADSSDGVAWTVRDGAGSSGSQSQPVFRAGAPGGFDAFSVGSPSVVLDESQSVGSPRRFVLWYEAGDVPESTENSIGVAFSANGLNWSDPQVPVLSPSSDLQVPLPFDSGDLEHPSALIDLAVPAGTEGHYLLWYSGDGENGASPGRIGFAAGRDRP